MAIVFTAVLLASAIIGVQGGHILNTQEEGTGPITASLNTETLKEGTTLLSTMLPSPPKARPAAPAR